MYFRAESWRHLLWTLGPHRFEVVLFQRDSAGFSMAVGGEDGLRLSLQVPLLLSFYLSLQLGGRYRRDATNTTRPWSRSMGSGWPRETTAMLYLCGDTGLSFTWRWFVEAHVWERRTPRWREYYVNITDALLGHRKYTSRDVLLSRQVLWVDDEAGHPVPYQATVRVHIDTWKRPRWPFALRLVRSTTEVEGGVPVPGKYGCDKGSVNSQTKPHSITAADHAYCPVLMNSIVVSEALEAFAEAVYDTRRRRR